ncbi:hypothetical protein FRB99_006726 [Tulasnella sp. 403]|nr:hypothetical protein FRB99_006726 [Tulasnella sp. 403]
MDMSPLRDSLPPGNLAQADRVLLDNFKAAALSITTLYKSSLKHSKRSYNAGYAACLLDVLHFIQAGVSAEGRMAELGGHDGSGALGLNLNFDVDGDGMTIGRVMDWVENRLETIRSEEEEGEGGGDEEEDKARSAKKKAPIASTVASRPKVTSAAPPVTRPTEPQATAPASVSLSGNATNHQPQPPSFSPAPPQTRVQSGALTRSRSKPEKVPRLPLGLSSANGPPTLTGSSTSRPDSAGIFSPGVEVDFPSFASEPPAPLLGTKRRHAAIVSELVPSPSASANGTVSAGSGSPTNSARQVINHGSGPARRRTRGNGSNATRPAVTVDADIMEVEEQEPARKRVARR